jgi:hypothetical protein
MKRFAHELLGVARALLAEDEPVNPIPMPSSLNTTPVAQETSVWYEDEDFEPDAYDLLLSRLIKVSNNRGYTLRSLGSTGAWPIILVEHNREKTNGPNVLVVAGLHGEEPAGPWGALRYLEIVPDEVLARVNLFVIPVINPTGFRVNKRDNESDESTNSGYRPEVEEEEMSQEGHILKAQTKELARMASHAFLSLHEDGDEENFYLYATEDGPGQSKLTKLLLGVGTKHFGLVEDKTISPPGSGHVVDGVIFNDHDGSFEDYMHKVGCPHCYCTETPMKAELSDRIRADVALIDALVKGVVKGLA